MNGESRGSTLAGVGVGLAIGTILGLAIGFLFAPKSGVETREMLRERADEIKGKASDVIEKSRERVGGIVEKGKERMEQMRRRGEEPVGEA